MLKIWTKIRLPQQRRNYIGISQESAQIYRTTQKTEKKILPSKESLKKKELAVRAARFIKFARSRLCQSRFRKVLSWPSEKAHWHIRMYMARAILFFSPRNFKTP
jgi:hypothetical protein